MESDEKLAGIVNNMALIMKGKVKESKETKQKLLKVYGEGRKVEKREEMQCRGLIFIDKFEYYCGSTWLHKYHI